MEQFNNSIGFDKRFWKVDIKGSVEYAKALARAGILTNEEAQLIEKGFAQVSMKDNFSCALARLGNILNCNE